MLKHLTQIKKYMPYLGGLIAFMSLIFIGQKIAVQFNGAHEASFFSQDVLILIFLLSITFAILSATLGVSWRYLLQAEGFAISMNFAISIFGKSQIAIYIPSKLVNLEGRQTLAINAGCSHQTLIKSTIWEIFLHAFAAGFMGSLLLVYAVPSGLIKFYALILTIIFSFALPSIYRLIEKDRIFALSGYMVFHLVSGVMFAYLISHLSHHQLSINLLAMIAGAYCLAWLSGFILPGAPSGLGVREVGLYLLISPWVDDKVLLNAIVASRIIITLGDIGFYLIGCGLSQLKSSKPSASYTL